MSYRRWLIITIHLALLFHISRTMSAQQEPVTADQVIAKYLQAIGAERFPSITTFVERGELYGNVTNYWQGSRSPVQSQVKQRGTYEYYFKSPNLRFRSWVTEANLIEGLQGCDGNVSWSIDASLQISEHRPKLDDEQWCEQGFLPMPLASRKSDMKTRLTKKKEIEGHMAWEIKVDEHKSRRTTTYYFDAETFLLLRTEMMGATTNYSDYRDVGGMKLPFTVTHDYANSKLVNKIREVKVNGPVEDARFIEPKPKKGRVSLVPGPSQKPANVETAAAGSQGASANASEASIERSAGINETAKAANVTEVSFPNFTTCSISELQMTVPEVNGLKPALDQRKLEELLDKVGAKTVEIARDTPNLISREAVTETQDGFERQRDYDYLILTHIVGRTATLDEFRVDLKTGERFQTEKITNNAAPTQADLERANRELEGSETDHWPKSQGFANSWVHFYPLNRSQATFRYLGEEKMKGRRMLVLAFAEKPPAVLSPAIFRNQGKTVPMFIQGIAWIDPSDFRIVRLRTDLLSPVPEVSLHRLTADIEYGPTRIDEVPSVLWLPHEVRVVSQVGGMTIREDHQYSDYRLFRARSRIVVDP